jgi:transcriptional regulator with PAS, ATPase and Fis domain
MQMKLLRALQEREFERVGDSHTIKIDVRVIGATNVDLARMVADGTFREDLFYRLNVIPIHLPPLRERREDIPLLVQQFVQHFCLQSTPPRPPVAVAQEALRRLMGYHWPGNVRQLENVVERSLALSPGRSQIELADLPSEIQNAADTLSAPTPSLPEDGLDFEDYISRIERELIRQSLERTQGNKLQAAKLLNLKRTTLIEKLRRLEKPVV